MVKLESRKIVEEFSISDAPQYVVDNSICQISRLFRKIHWEIKFEISNRRDSESFQQSLIFQVRSSLLKKILEEFFKSDLQNSILVIHLRSEVTQDQINSIREVAGNPPEGKLIFIIKSPDDRPFSLDSLRETDVFVTTCEDDCSKAIDAMSDLNFETR